MESSQTPQPRRSLRGFFGELSRAATLQARGSPARKQADAAAIPAISAEIMEWPQPPGPPAQGAE